jgi:predicted dehydrogenase
MATLMAMLGGIELTAPAQVRNAAGELITGPKVKCGVIGLGGRGRDILTALSVAPDAEVTAICDYYPAFLRRASKSAPKAEALEDYRRILDNKEIKAVFIATPTHQHKDIALAALQAGKHVYCEAPLASTIADAKAIAKAAKAASKQVFQAGLQTRSDPQRHFLLQFIRSGATGRTVMARSQWHKKQSWRFTSPNPEREIEVNWRLDKKLSVGLIGEIGIHQVDATSWFIRDLPVAVTGFGGVLHWKDGRSVPDTIQAVFEYPNGANLIYDCTLANSFDADYEMLYGADAAVMIRGNKAWMFKEVDSPLLGWEVYARKDAFYKETGIALVANATKLVAQGENPVEEAPYANTTLSYAIESFLTNCNEVGAGVEDFLSLFSNASAEAIQEHLSTLTLQPAAGWREGLDATIVAIKANEAIMSGQRIVFAKDLFELA